MQIKPNYFKEIFHVDIIELKLMLQTLDFAKVFPNLCKTNIQLTNFEVESGI